MGDKVSNSEASKLMYLPLPKQRLPESNPDTERSKQMPADGPTPGSVIRERFKSNPLLPIGAAMALFALIRGSYNGIVKRNSKVSGDMMKWCVFGQALMFGGVLGEMKLKEWRMSRDMSSNADSEQQQSD